MKENLKHFQAVILIISLITLFIFSNTYSYASITQSTNTGNITISNVEEGVTVLAYQLSTVNYDYTSDQPEAVPYTWDSNLKTWIDEKYPNYSDPETFYKTVTNDSTQAKEFYSNLAAALRGTTVNITPQEKTVEQANFDGTVTFENLQMGTYLVLIENGYKVYTPVIVNLVPEFNQETSEWDLKDEQINAKATNPQITKTVTNETSQADSYSTKDTIKYRIEADIPTYLPNSLSKTYCISDELTGGLILTESSIKVYGQTGDSEKVELQADTHYTKGTQRPNGTEVDFAIDFVYDEISSYDKIIIEYEATLAKGSSTEIGGNGNTNKAYLDYSNNPYVEDSDNNSIQTQETTDVKVYTYGTDLTKTDKSTGKPLSGAQFKLLSEDGKEDTALYFVKGADGKYYQANSTDTGATQTLEVDSNGKLYIYGLNVDVYYLLETKAPDGYNRTTTTTQITIVDKNLDGKLDDGVSGIVTITFPNSQGFQLPTTGGNGTIAFVTGGVVFVGIGIILLVISSKRENLKIKLK